MVATALLRRCRSSGAFGPSWSSGRSTANAGRSCWRCCYRSRRGTETALANRVEHRYIMLRQRVGRSPLRASEGEESPGSTETTVPDNEIGKGSGRERVGPYG